MGLTCYLRHLKTLTLDIISILIGEKIVSMRNLKRERFQCKYPQKCEPIDCHDKKGRGFFFGGKF